jgi:Baseplate J-like protein
MPLTAPVLDTRRFDDLIREARERIPRYTPDWTNFNDSDPGMTLVQLHAWMTETILYELNRVPDLNYIKFLNLIDVTPEPARPAVAEIEFKTEKLDKPGDELVVPVPLATKIAVDDPQLTQEILFETDRTLVALNAQVGAAIAGNSPAGFTRELVTGYVKEPVWLHSFQPFASGNPSGSAFYIGLLLRPVRTEKPDAYNNDRLPAGPLDLYVEATQVFDKDPEGLVIAGPLARACLTASVPFTSRIEWQLFTGDAAQSALFTDPSDAGWTTLSASSDTTADLSRSGHVVLELPAGGEPVSPSLLSATFWTSFGEDKPPVTKAELIATLQGPLGASMLDGLADKWKDMGVADATDQAALAACKESVADTVAKLNTLTVDPAKLKQSDWEKINPEFAAGLPVEADQFRELYWIRAKIKSAYQGEEPRPGLLNAVRLNTVPATQAATRLEESLGRSNGRPAQTFSLPKTPVLISPLTNTPELELAVTSAGNTETWTRVDDFFKSGPQDTHFLLDPKIGTLTFGDGRRGRIPVADAQVVANRYRVGGGAIGNVGGGTITKIKGKVRGIKAALNVRAAHDGSDAEPLETVKLRAPHDLRNLKRAMSAEDFGEIALQTPGVSLHRAYAIARRAVDASQNLFTKDGAVTLVVLPKNKEDTPQPSEAQLRAICAWLEPRRLITTELHITGPKYKKVTKLSGRLQIRAGFDLTAVADAVNIALMNFFHPIRGGSDGAGWPMGDDIFVGDLYELILDTEGVRRASELQIWLEGQPANWTDIIPLPEGHLPVLTRDVINMVPSYG